MDAASYIGMAFSRSGIAEKGILTSGVIYSVVKNKDCISGAQHFKLVDSGSRVNFVPCKVVVSTSKSNVYKVCSCMTLKQLFS